MKARFVVPAATALWLSGCMIGTVHTGPLQHESRTIDRDASERLRVDMRMGAGELRVAGGSPDWLHGDFTYNVLSWKPDVRYTSAGGSANLTVEQPDTGHSNMGNAKYECSGSTTISRRMYPFILARAKPGWISAAFLCAAWT
jgi:hypothetical protein